MAGRPPTTKEAWIAFAAAERPDPPPRLTLRRYRDLSPSDRDAFDAERCRFHGSLGPYMVAQARRINADTEELLQANLHLPADRARPSGALDGDPFLGKTTLLRAIGRHYERARRAAAGMYTDEGHEYLPVCHVALPKDSSIAGLNGKLATFMHLPERRKESQASLTRRIVDAMWKCETELVLIDDIHFAAGSRGRRAEDLNDHIKDLMNELAATFLVAGVALEEIRFFGEGKTPSKQRQAQIGGRFRHFAVQPLDIGTDEGLADWRALLSAVGRDLQLLGGRTRLDSKEMGLYLFGRSGGSIGHLMELIRIGAERAIKEERDPQAEPRGLTIDLLEQIQIGYSAECRRPKARRRSRGRPRARPPMAVAA